MATKPLGSATPYVGPAHRPRFSDTDIIRLRDARREFARDLDYLGGMLPLVAAFPDARELLRVHQDLSRSVKLQAQVDSGEVPPLADSSQETFEAAQRLSAQLSDLRLLHQAIKNADAAWTSTLAIF